MIGNNNIYLNVFQIPSALHMYPLAHLPDICLPPNFFVVFPWWVWVLVLAWLLGCHRQYRTLQFLPSPLHCNCFKVPQGSGSKPERRGISSLSHSKGSKISSQFSFIPTLVTGKTTILFRKNLYPSHQREILFSWPQESNSKLVQSWPVSHLIHSFLSRIFGVTDAPKV